MEAVVEGRDDLVIVERVRRRDDDTVEALCLQHLLETVVASVLRHVEFLATLP